MMARGGASLLVLVALTAGCAAEANEPDTETSQGVTVRPSGAGATLRLEGPVLAAPDTFADALVTVRLEDNQEVQVPLGQDTPFKAGRVCFLNIEHEGAEPPCVTLESGRAHTIGLGAIVVRVPQDHEPLGALKPNKAKLAYPGTLSTRLWLVGPTRRTVVEPRKLSQIELDPGFAGTFVLDVEEARFADGCAVSVVASRDLTSDAVFISEGARPRRRLMVDLPFTEPSPTTLRLQGQASYSKALTAPANGTLKLTRIDVDAPAGIAAAKYQIIERTAQGAQTVCAAPVQTGMFVLPGTYEVRTTWKDPAGLEQLSVSVVVAP
jgi:hypothetical protein